MAFDIVLLPQSGFNIDFSGGTVSGTTGYIKVWGGVSWDAKPVKVWDGASWSIKPIKVWDGASWVSY